ncbi:YigZ family protein [uncultured Desulfovibrio sp.]|jgi:uncharacterized YigZ family protein|uniref:YigZ family protein n=1 Tax=uncultured Desulfovibrio sp. TaxID=167968 RepID=UPI0021FD97BB|nr:YigZ family protein [uncultured Desulfovibrio sp.]CAI3232410.1 FIG000605: protein co-occurring with transport systems (COG1739) [Desulfovibrio diazotrophicus]
MSASRSRYPVPAAAPDAPHCTELVIRRSRFLAQSAHTSGPTAARAFVEALRRRHTDATHNCWAYVAGPPGHTAQIGSSDDGEPHGTAGRPMLQVLLHSPVGEICVVVSRWFGGVKLGTGGLVRAYQDSVRQNLESLVLCERVPQIRLMVTVDYACLDALRRLLPVHEVSIVDEDYAVAASLTLRLPEEQESAFCAALAGVSNGAAICVRTVDAAD